MQEKNRNNNFVCIVQLKKNSNRTTIKNSLIILSAVLFFQKSNIHSKANIFKKNYLSIMKGSSLNKNYLIMGKYTIAI